MRSASHADELDLGGVIERWADAVAAPHRLHVVVADATDPAASWRALGRVVGFDADRLPLPDASSVDAPADPWTLRLIADSSGLLVDHDELVELTEHWAKAVAGRGHDVVGDLTDLVPVRPAGPTDPARAAYDDRVDILTAALTEAVAEVGRLRERLGVLEQRNAKLERKRRRLGRRLAAVS